MYLLFELLVSKVPFISTRRRFCMRFSHPRAVQTSEYLGYALHISPQFQSCLHFPMHFGFGRNVCEQHMHSLISRLGNTTGHYRAFCSYRLATPYPHHAPIRSNSAKRTFFTECTDTMTWSAPSLERSVSNTMPTTDVTCF
jgi:hypothetical protein